MRPPHDRPRPLRSGATACATARHSRPPGDGHRARFTGAPRAPPPDNPVTAGVERLAEALYELAGGPQLVITRLFHRSLLSNLRLDRSVLTHLVYRHTGALRLLHHVRSAALARERDHDVGPALAQHAGVAHRAGLLPECSPFLLRNREPDLGNAPTPGPLAGESIRSARLAIAVPAVSVDQDLETERDVDAVERGEHECPVGEVTTTADEDAGHDSPL